jgi:hypothetical protein
VEWGGGLIGNGEIEGEDGKDVKGYVNSRK